MEGLGRVDVGGGFGDFEVEREEKWEEEREVEQLFRIHGQSPLSGRRRIRFSGEVIMEAGEESSS